MKLRYAAGQTARLHRLADLQLLFACKAARFSHIAANMGLIVRKPVFGVSDQAMLLPDCSATDTTTSYNVEIMLKEVKIFCRSD